MRYYVLCFSDESGIAPHIVAEVVRGSLESEENREHTLASAIAGPRAVIATRQELQSEPAGSRALEAWDERDDSEYDHESIALLSEEAAPTSPPTLRLVGADEVGQPRTRPGPRRRPHKEGKRDG